MPNEYVLIYRKLIRTKLFYESRCGAKKCNDGLKWYECETCFLWFHRNCSKLGKLNRKFYCSNCFEKK